MIFAPGNYVTIGKSFEQTLYPSLCFLLVRRKVHVLDIQANRNQVLCCSQILTYFRAPSDY